MTCRLSFSTIAAVALTVLSLGCRSQQIDDRANEELSDLRGRTAWAVVYPTCYSDNAFDVNCGLITKRVSDEDFRLLFREKRCQGASDEKCQVLYQRLIDAELTRRYYAADVKAVALTCDLHAQRCEDPKAYELLLLDSHNHHVRDEHAKKENSIERAREHAQAAHIGAQVELAMRVADETRYALHEGPKCRTYPGVFRGWITTCQ